MGLGAGVNFSQLDGDDFTGYDKVGTRFGLRSHAYLTEKLDLVIEMNLEQKGSRFGTPEQPQVEGKNRTIALLYAEIPVILRWFFTPKDDFFFEMGGSIGYMVKDSYKVEQAAGTLAPFEEVSGKFNRSEWNILMGAGYEFSEHWGFLFRTSFGVTHLYNDPSAIDAFLAIPHNLRGDEEPITQLRNYLVSAGVYYML